MSGAHPRVGGENRQTSSARTRSGGSSPRGRGKHRELLASNGFTGLIPAWAGKTRRCDRRSRRKRAHPRVGGENWKTTRTVPGSDGSSPRGRGKLGLGVAGEPVCGLIPAWAGKTGNAGRASRSTWAHPRVGGENEPLRFVHPYFTGSSPRGRGKRRSSRADRTDAGLIPAWAGKTRWPAPSTRSRPAHPRVGGENPGEGAHVPQFGGSSPRGRGKRRLVG